MCDDQENEQAPGITKRLPKLLQRTIETIKFILVTLKP